MAATLWVSLDVRLRRCKLTVQNLSCMQQAK